MISLMTFKVWVSIAIGSDGFFSWPAFVLTSVFSICAAARATLRPLCVGAAPESQDWTSAPRCCGSVVDQSVFAPFGR
jgi:hypothetical protein